MRYNWSILSKAGSTKAVLDYYSGLDGYKSKAMEDGIELHDKIATERLELVPMQNPKFEVHLEAEYEGDVISGYIDVLCDDMIIDWKLSVKNAGGHDMWQLDFYNWLLKLVKIKQRKYGMIVQINKDLEVLSKAMKELDTDMEKWFRKQRAKILFILAEKERSENETNRK